MRKRIGWFWEKFLIKTKKTKLAKKKFLIHILINQPNWDIIRNEENFFEDFDVDEILNDQKYFSQFLDVLLKNSTQLKGVKADTIQMKHARFEDKMEEIRGSL